MEYQSSENSQFMICLKRIPINCACWKKFDVDHALTCMKGGFIHRRHDRIRDVIAIALDEVTSEVQTEPHLQPLTGESFPPSTNKENDARLDIAARGFWQKCEMAFFDVRVFNPFAKSHLSCKLDAVFRSNEMTKKRSYNERIIQVEHGSFTPIVMSAYGGFGKETSIFISRLIDQLSKKNDMQASIVANYLRTKIAFELVRAQVMCIRGSRSLRKPYLDVAEIEVVQNKAKIQE